jgi:hypothetical protein
MLLMRDYTHGMGYGCKSIILLKNYANQMIHGNMLEYVLIVQNYGIE